MAKAKRKVHYSVTCEKHGVMNSSKSDAAKFVTVPIPKNKKERYNAGCPRCKQELIAQQRLEKESV